jgi:hypothetical protein
MKFAELRRNPLHNMNQMVPDFDAPDFLVQLNKLRDFTYRRDYFPTEEELASQKFKNTSMVSYKEQENLFDDIMFVHTMFFPVEDNHIDCYMSVKSIYPNGC